MGSSLAEYDRLVADGVWPVLGDGSVEALQAILDRLAGMDGSLASDAERVDLLGVLEQVKGAVAAAQARVTVEFDTSQLAAQDARGVRAKDRGRGIGDQVALARGCAASQGSRHLGFAKAIVAEMPHTHALLTTGDISEWTAIKLVKETAILTLEDRRLVDERLCAMRVDTANGQILPPVVLGLTSNQAGGRARALADQLDPEAAADRASKAKKDRRVTIRPTPDTMTYVTGLVPVDQGVACWAKPGNTFLADCGFLGALSCDGSQEVGYFWSEALGWPLVWDQDQETAIRSSHGGPKVTWGGPPVAPKAGKNRLHFDLVPPVDGDQQAEVEHLVSLGATRIDIGEGEVNRVVMTDPDSNEFCVLAAQ